MESYDLYFKAQLQSVPDLRKVAAQNDADTELETSRFNMHGSGYGFKFLPDLKTGSIPTFSQIGIGCFTYLGNQIPTGIPSYDWWTLHITNMYRLFGPPDTPFDTTILSRALTPSGMIRSKGESFSSGNHD